MESVLLFGLVITGLGCQKQENYQCQKHKLL